VVVDEVLPSHIELRILNCGLQKGINSARTVIPMNTNCCLIHVLLLTGCTAITHADTFITGLVVGAPGRLTPNGMRIGEAANRTRVRSGASQWAMVRRSAGELYSAARHPR